MATISAVIVTIDACWRGLSQMLLASERYRDQAMAVWSGTSMAPIFAGTSQHGFPFAATEMSHFGGGGGARTYADGVDTAGIVFNTTPNMPNLEDQEAEYPVLYLFRRHLQDSGGPGRFRGGRSGELAYTVYDSPDNRLEGLFAGTGAEMPNAIGLNGGMPGAAIRVARVRRTDVADLIERGEKLPAALEEVEGELEILCCKHTRSPMARGDVWYHSWQAGGGYGDPLLRNPQSVATDVERGAVSEAAARDIYGVVIGSESRVEAEATAKRRAEIRAARLAAATPPEESEAEMRFRGSGMLRIGDALTVDFEGNRILCGHCGQVHCRADEDLLPALRELATPLSAAGSVRGQDYDTGRFSLRQLCCRHCGTLVDAQVALDGAPRSWFRMDRPLATEDRVREVA
jgi:N-methylhydantoinase B